MKGEKLIYAAVGAPVVAGRKVASLAENFGGQFNEGTGKFRDSATKSIDEWAVEGEKLISKVGDRKVVDELTSKVDFDQVQEQVGKLRDQLEDMVATWKTSFRPGEKTAEKAGDKVKDEESAKKPPAKATTAKATAKAGTKKTTTARSTATKKPAASTKAATTKKPAASASKAATSKAGAPKTGASKAGASKKPSDKDGESSAKAS